RPPVSLALARAEAPVGVGPRLFPPEDRGADAGRRTAGASPRRSRTGRGGGSRPTRPTAGARFGHVPADAGHGWAAGFRAGLAERALAYAVGVPPAQKVCPAEVTLASPGREGTG